MRIFPVKRPYWFVDAKWICGILLVFTLTATLILLSLVRLTDQQRGPTVGALVIGMGFIRGESVDTQEARQELAKRGGVIHPIPNIPSIQITEADLSLSAAEISLKVFKPITESIYNEGIEATADKFGATPEQKEEFIKDAYLFNIFTKETHATFKKLFTILALISVLLGAAVVYFSSRWGRLSNLGLLLFLVSLPGTLFSLMLRNPPKDGDEPLAGLRPELAQQIGEALNGYSKITWLGLLLLIAALTGKIVTALTHKPKSARRTS